MRACPLTYLLPYASSVPTYYVIVIPTVRVRVRVLNAVFSWSPALLSHLNLLPLFAVYTPALA